MADDQSNKKALTVRSIPLLKAGTHLDQGCSGLHIQVSPTGACSWLFRYRFSNKRRWMGLGSYPDVGLAKARSLADDARKLLNANIDPLEHKSDTEAQKQALIKAASQKRTFKDVMNEWLAAKSPGWSNPKHVDQNKNTLETYAAALMEMDVDAIELSDVLACLKPYWLTKTETMSRTAARISQVLSMAIALEYRKKADVAAWDVLGNVLASPSKVKTVRHMPSLPAEDISALWQQLLATGGQGAKALQWIILTAARSGETRMATYSEINFEQALWTIPATHTKMRRIHEIPLCKEALDLIRLPTDEQVEPSRIIFPGTKGQMLSDMSISAVLRRLKVSAVPHGFRSSFAVWAAQSGYPVDIIDRHLAHQVGSSVARAYQRDHLLTELRRPILDAWGKICCGVSNNVHTELIDE